MDFNKMQLKKIKIDSKERVELIFDRRVLLKDSEGGEDREEKMPVVLPLCPYKPHRDLMEAMLSLRKHALKICELPDDEKHRVAYTVTSVVISGSMEDHSSRVMFSLAKHIKRSGKIVNISTPQTVMYGEDYEGAEDMVKLIEKLIAEAILYMNGKNGSGVLVLDFGGMAVNKKAA